MVGTFQFFSRRPAISGEFEHLTSFNALYHPCKICGGFHAYAKLDNKFSKESAKRAEEIAKQIYDGSFSGPIDPELTSLVAQELTRAVAEGYGKTLSEVDYASKDAAMLRNLEQNCYQFSAAKNYQELRDITNAMKDADGNLRSFKDFKDAANKISYQYNQNWLQTEYNTAIAGGQMASRWVDFEQNKGDLQYITAGDDRVREEHALLDGVVKPIDDDFWDTYYPPNDYNCRCDVVQLTGGDNVSGVPEKEMSPEDYPPINPLFKVNLAKNELIFSKNHPYYNGVPIEVLKNALKVIPPENAYRTLYPNVDVHVLHERRPEFKNNFIQAKELADNGFKVKLLPVFEENEKALAKLHMPEGVFPGKYPDALVNEKIIVEFEKDNVGTNSGIHNAIRNGKEQSDIVLLNSKMPLDEILRYAKGQLTHNPALKELWISNDSGINIYEVFSKKVMDKNKVSFVLKDKRR